MIKDKRRKKKSVPITLTLLQTAIGVLFGLVADDGATLLHIVVPKMEFVHRMFSDSAFGDETSTYFKRNNAIY